MDIVIAVVSTIVFGIFYNPVAWAEEMVRRN